MLSDLLNIWAGFGPETKAALIGAVSTLAAAIGGFGGLILQVRSQGRQNRASVAENERRRLKAAMYEESVGICNELSDKNIDYTTKLRSAGTQILMAAKVGELAASSMSPNCSLMSLRQSFYQCHDAAVRFIIMIERRRIIDPRMAVFRTVMNATLHDMRQNFEQRIVPIAWPAFPTFAPDGRQNHYVPLSEQSAEKINRDLTEIADQASDVGCHIEDFLVEMQNHLLGDLFGHEVAHRVPLDRRYRVTTLNAAPEIERDIMTESEWGKLAQQTEKNVLAGLTGKAEELRE